MLEALRYNSRARYRIGRYQLMATLLRHAPLHQAYRLARWHGRRYYNRRRPNLQDRADDMCGRLDATAEQVDAWLTRYYELAASEQLDRILYQRMSADEIDRLIEVRGLGHLEDALRRGKGAILCSGHVMGHFTFFTALGLRGFPLHMVGFEEPVSDEALAAERVASHQNAFMEERLGIRFIKMAKQDFGVAVKALNALRDNGVVSFEIDQSVAKRRLEADFLGSPGHFPVGHVKIAMASGAPLLHFWIRRTDGWLPQIAEISAPYYVGHDEAGAVRHCATAIERRVIEDPPSWQPWLYSRRHVWEADDH